MYRRQYYLLAYQMVLFNYLKWFKAVKHTILVHRTQWLAELMENMNTV